MISAEFFDIFGLVGFLILFYLGISIRKKVKKKAWIIIAISILGIIVDGFIVINTYLLGK